MSLIARLDDDFKSALKAKEAEKLSVLRLVRSAIKNLEIAKQASSGDEDIIAILQREIKQHKETIESLKKAGRNADVAKQEAEVALLQTYLPPALSLDELKDVVSKAINSTGASSISDLGKVMGQVMSQVKGRATGDEVGQMVRELLSK